MIKSGITILGNPEEGFMDAKNFCNSQYHLNSVGVEVRTSDLIKNHLWRMTQSIIKVDQLSIEPKMP